MRNEYIPIAQILVGPPAVGKSTWLLEESMKGSSRKPVIISSDNYIEFVAKERGKTYNEVFQDAIKDATKYVQAQKEYAVANRLDIIWDQTNLTAKKRRKCLDGLDAYHAIAVTFEMPPVSVWEHRLNSRVGKTIPNHILQNMLETYETPELSEGFRAITHVPYRNEV